MFQPVGSLHLDFSEHADYTNYYRELDIERAITKTSYTVGETIYTRHVLASFADRVIIVHLTASSPASISFSTFATVA